MNLFALIPVKGLKDGKTRLKDALDDVQRAALNARLADRVLEAAFAARGVSAVIVVSPDDAALAWAVARGAVALREPPGGGLNFALDDARTLALTLGADSVLVLPADLPLVDTGDIAALAGRAVRGRAMVIAPDAAGFGTNALLLRPAAAIPFRFGAGSFRAHLAEARRARLPVRTVRRTGLAFDLDTPDDLARLRAARP